MPRLTRGRFVGKRRGDVGPPGLPVAAWEEIVTLTTVELERVAESFEAALAAGPAADHPAWLAKRAARVRTLIARRERAKEHRDRQR